MASIVPEAESQAAPLPSVAQLRAARIAVQKKAAAEAAAKAAADDAKRQAAEEAALAKKNPARIWVQVATGNNQAGLSGTWKKLREKAPEVFRGQSAAYVPWKATNRVVVGPFKSKEAAHALVSAMGKAGLQGSTFSSEAGQEVSRIGGK
jgi:cell division septation protein DedD